MAGILGSLLTTLLFRTGMRFGNKMYSIVAFQSVQPSLCVHNSFVRKVGSRGEVV